VLAGGDEVSALLQAKNVVLRYSAKGPDVVKHVSLDVQAGDAIGIVGESGSGKSSLARLLVGAVAPSSGEVLIDGRPWSEVSRKNTRRREVQMVFQDPYGSLNPLRTALQTVAEVLRVARGAPAPAANREAANLLREVGLPADTFGRRAQGLSGGQCQRVGIARALACEPKVLIADEPTSALDVSVQAQILNLLNDLREQRGLALVLISHDLGVIHYATRTTYVMHSGRVVESGDTDEIFERPSHHYTQALLDSLPENGGAKLAARDLEPRGCSFAARCPAMRPDCLAAPPPPKMIGPGHQVSCLYPAIAPDHRSDATERAAL
jgi:oligopeptide/dipeptide ABC transporter ATP-binding protein